MKTKVQEMMDAMEREGDPKDVQLNYIEENLIMPRMFENRVQKVACKTERKEFEICQQKYGIASAIACFFPRMYFLNCCSNERGNEDVRDDCLEEYLALRSRYRITRDSKLLRRMKAMVFPSRFPDDS